MSNQHINQFILSINKKKNNNNNNRQIDMNFKCKVFFQLYINSKKKKKI